MSGVSGKWLEVPLPADFPLLSRITVDQERSDSIEISTGTSTILFAAVTLVIAIAISTFLSTVFGLGLGQTLGPVVAWIGVTYIYHQVNKNGHDTQSTAVEDDDHVTGKTGSTDADTTADSPGPDVEPQSQAYSFSDTDDTREPRNRTGLRRSNDDILEETGTKLDDFVTFKDDGTIALDNYDDLDLYRRLMLYVVAKRMAYEDRFIDATEVTVTEINDRRDLPYNKIELLLFLNEARKWLVAPTEAAPALRTIDYTTLDNAVFTVRTRSLAKIADWILDEPLPDMRPSDLSSRLSSTAMMLKDARNQYDDIREDGVTNASYNADHRYEPVRQKIVRACEYAGEYPVMFERDNAWTQFTEYAEALLDFFEDGLYTKTEHCLPEMQRYQRHMEEKADDVSYF